MTPLPPVPGVFALDHAFSYGSDSNVHFKTYHKYSGAALTKDQAENLAGNAMVGWSTSMKGLHVPQCTITSITCTDLSDPAAQQAAANTPFAGTRTGGELTAETCLVWSLKIARRYRGGHPRKYLPLGAATDLSTPQQWAGAFLTAAQTGWSAYQTAIKSGAGGAPPATLVNVSYYHGGSWVQSGSGAWHFHPALRGTPVVDDVVSEGPRAKPGSQRRRMR